MGTDSENYARTSPSRVIQENTHLSLDVTNNAPHAWATMSGRVSCTLGDMVADDEAEGDRQ